METVTSRDGTRIALERRGSGPARVLVHGATAEHSRWAPIVGQFENRCTVFAIDRRGRGGSGDAPTYDAEREWNGLFANAMARMPL